ETFGFIRENYKYRGVLKELSGVLYQNLDRTITSLGLEEIRDGLLGFVMDRRSVGALSLRFFRVERSGRYCFVSNGRGRCFYGGCGLPIECGWHGSQRQRSERLLRNLLKVTRRHALRFEGLVAWCVLDHRQRRQRFCACHRLPFEGRFGRARSEPFQKARFSHSQFS